MTFFGGLFKGLAAVVVSALALGLFAVAAGPTASFTMTPDGNPVVGQAVQFTDASTGGPTSWSWNFGDGQSSTQQNPTHVYGGPGPFTVTLTAANASGSSQATQAAMVLTPNTGCTPDATTLCIDDQPGDRRFKIQVTYHTSQGGGSAGNGTAIQLSSLGVSQGGLFWFFSASNPELLIKVLDGCGFNNQHWVFASAGTNVGLTITVTDTSTGVQKVYTNADLQAMIPIQDVSAFVCSGLPPTPTPPTTPTATPTPTQTPTPTVPALTVVNLVASNFQWDFDGGGDSFTFHVGRAYQLRTSRVSGTLHQFSGISAFGCSGSGLSSTAVCNFTPTAGQIGTHGFGCTNSGCGSGHDTMSASGKAIVAP
jgi:PKD repeat protein